MNKPLSGILSPCQEKEAAKKHGFTLVELIVVITILAILGTIAFISLQGYSKDARDSTRISDLSSMKISLELFQLNAGKYPETTAGFVVTYSGAEVWTQGTFGETTKSNVEKIDKIPKDPLTEKEYTYSITKTKQEYELAGLVEGDLAYVPHTIFSLGEKGDYIFEKANAAEIIATAIVTGNYNGQTLKSETGTTCEVLSIPSIISSELVTTDLKTILDNKSLVYNGFNNLPSNYEGSKYKTDEGFEFETKKLVVYSDNQECKPLYDTENSSARINLVKNLQTAYSGTLIENSENIRGLVALDISDSQAVNFLSATLVNNNLGGTIDVNSGGGTETPSNSCATQPNYTHATFTVGTPTSVDQEYIKDASNCGYTCTDGYTGNDCSVAPPIQFLSNCTANGQIYYTDNSGNRLATVTNIGEPTWVLGKTISDLTCDGHIIVCSGNNAGYMLQACNLGSATVGTTLSSFGKYFQWGNNGGTPSGTITPSTTLVNTITPITYGPGNYYNNTTFRGGPSLPVPYDWSTVKNDNLWGDDGGNGTDIQRKGPCNTGYHVPSQLEWQNIVIAGGWGSNGTNLVNTLKIPMAGGRERGRGDMYIQNSYGIYWSSSPSTNTSGYSYRFRFYSGGIDYNNTNGRAFGFSLRCIKN